MIKKYCINCGRALYSKEDLSERLCCSCKADLQVAATDCLWQYNSNPNLWLAERKSMCWSLMFYGLRRYCVRIHDKNAGCDI